VISPPLRVFPPRTDPAPPDKSPPGELRGRLRVDGHPVTIRWWRRPPPPEVDDAVRLEPDFWLSLRVE
jgi:hypothetical protein